MKNGVLSYASDASHPATGKPGVRTASRVEQLVGRALSDRQDATLKEIRRLMEAGYAVMRETGQLEPRVSEIVRAAGLSNQAFYRHFKSKDELLLAILDDGQRTLVGYLQHRMQGVAGPLEAVRRWLEGVLVQAVHPRAARATRPFVIHRARLAERFPEEVRRTNRLLVEPLAAALAEAVAAGLVPDGDAERDADALYHLAMGWMQLKLVEGGDPTAEDAAHVADFGMRGLFGRASSSAGDSRGA
jgi:AcrR family transcriptional regulator